MLDLNGIQIVIDHASPGPWEQSLSSPDAVIAPNRAHSVDGDMVRYYGGPVVGESIGTADRMFLVVARQRMPELVDELRAARQIIGPAKAIYEDGGYDPVLFAELGVALDAYDKVVG